jgi:hypothetical protein
MVSLRISKPSEPLTPGRPKYFVYTVVLDNGREWSLPQLAINLKLPRSTLMRQVRDAGLGLGTHTDAFHKVLAHVKSLKRRPGIATRCPTCHGTGRIRPADSAPPIAASAAGAAE